ncbi:Ig-like domain-containing protein [Streptomyces sp. NBC_01190]|uniref:L,D-transpeptidase n=1 Tax=Streptomyces sp. NBC_01190 TaxID=2903767 RepID=UPI00386DF049|nr:Ig-like domain-containing protein [Streptomyces sp. NBC_01190]
MTPSDAGKTPAQRSRLRRRRTIAAAVVLAVGGAVGVAACGHGGGSDKAAAATSAPARTSAAPSASPSAPGAPAGPSGAASTPAATQSRVDADVAKQASDVKINITPRTGSTGADINRGTKVFVTDGTLTSVTMTVKPTGQKVAGTISADRTSWSPDVKLARGTQYQISAAATDTHGRSTTANSVFATVSTAGSFIGYFTPEDGSTVGVGMPVSINFDKPIASQDRAAVQKAVTVSSSSGQQVVGHWFGSSRLDLRPQNYWLAGSHVSLTLKLDGVEGAPGVHGVQDRTVSFDVGRSQVSTVDTQTHEMTVVRDGKVIGTIPISSGTTPQFTTYNGQMVISEKDQSTRMNSATVGLKDKDGKSEYDIPDVPHAMRLSTSGTFIHGNYWAAPSVFGHANTSHGCIGMADVKGGKDPNTPAAWFYNHSMVGDVVVVKNSPDKTIAPDNGLNGWNMSWSDWLAGSALR